ncbi:type II secretion system F family protein [Pseudoduganella armeniaca]|uniref:Type II secretion system protein n=1 Tax=Pseudoduganella armeniaca TaxID=2072590 RepID=A0A2R4CAF0_9BURK|nr:type II secretion system F family protein [Pseudoduganella armeniaca]AVR96627.1 type II secretion system protein [Pseudoduganella armeniaca]
MRFSVRIFDVAAGTVANLEVDGNDPGAVRAALAAQGHTVLALAPVGRGSAGVRRPFDVLLFCDELRTLLGSGMSLVEAVDTLHEKEAPGIKRQVFAGLQTLLAQGKSLSAALELSEHRFSPLLIASVRASERNSGLEAALDEYTAYERAGRDLRRKIATAAIYPLLVIAFGTLVCGFMLGYVVPRFARVYEDFSQSISWPTLALLRVAGFVDAHALALLASAALAACTMILAYRQGRLQPVLLHLLARWAPVRRRLRTYQLARLYQTLSMLLRGGFALGDALPLAQSLALDPTLQEQVVRARARLAEGQRLSKAFHDCGLTDIVTLRLLQVGERSGNLAHVLAMIAQAHRNEFMLFVERTSRVAEPLILMVVGMLIGALIVLMYMPVFDLAGGI